MKCLKKSIIAKIMVHVLLFIVGFLFILNAYYFTQFISKYPSTTTSFEQTEFFHEKYLKYVERVAEYIQYKEKGYVEDANHVYENPDIASILDTKGLENKTTDDSENTSDYSDQDAFEYYNQVLNIEKTNFVYYVKNTITGDIYSSPSLQKGTNEFQNPNNFVDNIENLDSYLVVNTNTSRYATSINNTMNYISTDDISWVIKCITGSLPRDNISSDNVSSKNISSDNASSDGVSSGDSSGNTDKLEDSNGTTDSNNISDSSQYLIYTGVLNNLPYQDTFKENRTNFYQLYNNYKLSLSLLPTSLILFIILLILLIYMCGHSKNQEGIVLNKFDHIYTEVAFLGIILLFLILIYFGILPLTRLIHGRFAYRLEIAFLLAYTLSYPIPTFGFFSFVRRIKIGSLYTNSLLFQLQKKVKNTIRLFLEYKDITFQIALAFGIFILIKFIASLCLILSNSSGTILYYIISVADYIYAGVCLFKMSTSLHVIVTETKKIADGDLNHKIPEKNLFGYMGLLGNYINHIGDGLSDAVDEKLKSERLKTELITNVSHDIKTPLTSIINYVDLLKKENIENETATSYLKVLETKSWRLKTLIEDLVEVSKASSGTTKLNIERLNIVELIRQSAGEFEDRLLSRNLEIVLNISEEPIYILADGRSTFRIIENIFSNVNKYALSGTRVYVDVIKIDKTVSVSVKNISANKLNIDSNELMERFVRGDIARNTEGSGLGLSIAKSLASLQNASFDIVLDGDLFKAIVCFTTID